MTVIYKILFEVKLLHEFYLTESNGKTIFDINAPADDAVAQRARLAYLSQKFSENRENINSEIEFKVPEQSKGLFANHHLKLVTTYAGFKVGIEVNAVKLPDGTITYEPKFPLPDGINIPVMLLRKNGFLDGFTNKTLNKPLNAGYYFSNDNITGDKTVPFLSAEISSFDPAANYEQGELVKFGPNDYREFYKDDGGVESWVPFTVGGYANDNDRLLVSTNFSYSFPTGANVTNAHITIKDADGNTIKNNEGNSISEFHFVSAENLRKVNISIDPSRVIFVPNSIANENLLYTLEVNGNNGYNKVHKIFFCSPELKTKGAFGMVNFKPKVTNPAFNIIDGLGKLLTRKQPDGIINPLPPVFEIRFRSRLSFWRYINNKRKAIQNGLHPDFLITKAGVLESIKPRALTYIPTLFRKADNTLHYLPNPERYGLIKIENDKMYSEITVRESDLFPLEP